MPDVNFSFNGSLPGETAFAALFSYLKECRSTMSQENRDAWDKRGLQVFDDWCAFWKTLARGFKE